MKSLRHKGCGEGRGQLIVGEGNEQVGTPVRKGKTRQRGALHGYKWSRDRKPHTWIPLRDRRGKQGTYTQARAKTDMGTQTGG